MNKICLIALFPFFAFVANEDCSARFSCKPAKSQGQDGYVLSLNLEQGNAGNYDFELYDLTTGNFIEKANIYFRPGAEMMVFSGVKPSTYTIYYSSSQCGQKKSISGKGIILQ
ncbi:MAG TPA: hypothetical protein VIS49_11585 [Cyclobacteriaceae bacterium]